jgi:hypothetical protein
LRERNLRGPARELSRKLTSILISKNNRRSLFLLDNNLTLTIYVPKQVAPAMLHDVFGVDQFALLEPGAIRLPVLNTEINHNLRNLVSFFFFIVCMCDSRMNVVELLYSACSGWTNFPSRTRILTYMS